MGEKSKFLRIRKEIKKERRNFVCTIRDANKKKRKKTKGNVFGVIRGLRIEGRVVIERSDTLEIEEEMEMDGREGARGEARLG